MKNGTKKVSGVFLRKSIIGIKRAQSGSFSQKKYARKLDLEDEADKCFEAYMKDSLIVDPKNRKLFARYINEFAHTKKNMLLDKLQSEADFDVRKYLETASLSWWRRIFLKKDGTSATEMKRKIAKANKLKKKIEKIDFLKSFDCREQLDELSNETERYIAAYNEGSFVPQDAEIFKSYIMSLGVFYQGSPAEQALIKLQETPVTKAPKKIKVKKNRKFSFVRSLKYAVVGIFVTFAGWFGVKKASNIKEAVKSVTEIKITPIRRNNANTLNAVAKQSFAQKHAEEANRSSENIKNIKITGEKTPVAKSGTDVSVSKEKYLNQKQKDMKAFYAKRLAQFTSESHAEKMINDLAKKVDVGIISLPNDISVNRFLYAEQIYQMYGFKDIANELKAVVSADKKIAKQKQEQLFQYVRNAGDKGEGVQKMAQQSPIVAKQVQKQDVAISKDNSVNQKQENMSDFYTKRLVQFTSEKRAEKMISDFAKKIDDGIVSLPEDISMTRFLYAEQIYHQYGFKGISREFKVAMKSDKKVAKSTQERLFNYVREAGERGVGVQKKAYNLQFKNLKELRESRNR